VTQDVFGNAFWDERAGTPCISSRNVDHGDGLGNESGNRSDINEDDNGDPENVPVVGYTGHLYGHRDHWMGNSFHQAALESRHDFLKDILHIEADSCEDGTARYAQPHGPMARAGGQHEEQEWDVDKMDSAREGEPDVNKSHSTDIRQNLMPVDTRNFSHLKTIY